MVYEYPKTYDATGANDDAPSMAPKDSHRHPSSKGGVMTTAENTSDESNNGVNRVYGNGHEQCFAEANRLRAELEKAHELLRLEHLDNLAKAVQLTISPESLRPSVESHLANVKVGRFTDNKCAECTFLEGSK